MARSIANQRDKLNQIKTLIAEYGRENEEKLIRFILENNHNLDKKKQITLADIARVLEVTPQAIHEKYPNLRKEILK